ncbi:hypothetical protein BDQ17DRAFT_1222300, partial [Cyathus striatus]
MCSLFQQYLGTNFAPSNHELEQIRELLKTSDKELRNIDVEIGHLNQRLQFMQEKRSRLKIITERYQALISPARQLPRDILEEIFLACLPTDRNPCISAAEAPILLTHICSSWRSIALSLPRLWSAIHIALP